MEKPKPNPALPLILGLLMLAAGPAQAMAPIRDHLDTGRAGERDAHPAVGAGDRLAEDPHVDVGRQGERIGQPRKDAARADAVQRHLSVSLWTWLVGPILTIPALPAFLVLGTIFLWLGGRDGEAADTGGFVIGSRPPRRRRSRGLG